MYKYVEVEKTPNDPGKIDLLNKIIQKNNTIILYHASWCGHCKMLMPIWEKSNTKPLTIDELNSSHLKHNFIIKIENSFKDTLYGIEVGNSFPTIYFYKKGVKKDEFSKDRTVKNLKAFFKKLKRKKQKSSTRRNTTKKTNNRKKSTRRNTTKKRKRKIKQ